MIGESCQFPWLPILYLPLWDCSYILQNENYCESIMARTKKNSMSDDMILALESRLAGVLKPVEPSKDMVHRLRERIRLPDREEIVSRLSDWKRMFLVFGGVMSGMLVMITLARAFFYLVGRKHI